LEPTLPVPKPFVSGPGFSVQQSAANQREKRESYFGSGFVFIREIRGKFFLSALVCANLRLTSFG
jgi:hypothetical protein